MKGMKDKTKQEKDKNSPSWREWRTKL